MKNFYQTIFLNIYLESQVKYWNHSLEPPLLSRMQTKMTTREDITGSPLTTRGGSCCKIQDSLNPHYPTSIYTHFRHFSHDLKAKMWWNCKMEAYANESPSICLPVQWDEFSLSEDLTEEEFYPRAGTTLTWSPWLHHQPEGPHSRPTRSSKYKPGNVPQFLQMVSCCPPHFCP